MRFTDLDTAMRIFETAHDHCVLPGLHIVVRIDGRNFTRLTREVCCFTAPYDESFRDHMVETTKHLMSCGFRVVYAYTQSDEISLLLDRDEDAFGRKLRKYESILAGEASAWFTHRLGIPAAFDARIAQLPDRARVLSYFRWRADDAHRNALNGHCYWQLRREGRTPAESATQLAGMSTAAKNDLLYERAGINFNDLPAWQRRGIGVYWEGNQSSTVSDADGTGARASGRGLCVDLGLPMKGAYEAFLERFIREDC
ncbi:MAG: guanylyltransferase [bacterium]|nr:guanylyltransferase [bacterium]